MNWWIKIVNIGIDPALKRSDIRSIQLTNSIIFISCIIAISYLPLLIWVEAKWMTIQLSILSLFIISTFIYPLKIKTILAIPLIALGIIYHITTVSISIQGGQLEQFLILVALIQFALIKNRYVSMSIFFTSILCYLYSIHTQNTTEVIIAMNTLQKIIMLSLNAIGLFIGGLYLIIQVKNITKKYKNDLLLEREIVENKNKRIKRQVEIIAYTNKELTDSINYSKRIQSAILPSHTKIKKLLPQSFIIYQPKDIVAGDFYWVEKTENNINFAVADCTGHGVPGAMMSVICSNALNRSIQEFKLTMPNEILDKTRFIVLQELDASEDNIKDGMDIALCSLSDNILNYSGANIKLYIVRANTILEYKPDKQPIGLYSGEEVKYTNHEIELQDNDYIYLVSDGYIDQFGGDKIKKFKTPALKKLLIEINNLPLTVQKIKLLKTFENWKGEQDQLDDICIMGIKFNK